MSRGTNHSAWPDNRDRPENWKAPVEPLKALRIGGFARPPEAGAQVRILPGPPPAPPAETASHQREHSEGPFWCWPVHTGADRRNPGVRPHSVPTLSLPGPMPEGFHDPPAGQLLLAVEGLGVDLQQHLDEVPSPVRDLRRAPRPHVGQLGQLGRPLPREQTAIRPGSEVGEVLVQQRRQLRGDGTVRPSPRARFLSWRWSRWAVVGPLRAGVRGGLPEVQGTPRRHGRRPRSVVNPVQARTLPTPARSARALWLQPRTRPAVRPPRPGPGGTAPGPYSASRVSACRGGPGRARTRRPPPEPGRAARAW